MPVFSAMPLSSFDVSISARATEGRRRALISKSSRDTVRLSTRIDSGARAWICARLWRSAPPDAGCGLVTETDTGFVGVGETALELDQCAGVDVPAGPAAGLFADGDRASGQRAVDPVAEPHGRPVVLVDQDEEVPVRCGRAEEVHGRREQLVLRLGVLDGPRQVWRGRTWGDDDLGEVASSLIVLPIHDEGRSQADRDRSRRSPPGSTCPCECFDNPERGVPRTRSDGIL